MRGGTHRGRGVGSGRPGRGHGQMEKGPNSSYVILAALVAHAVNHGLILREATQRVLTTAQVKNNFSPCLQFNQYNVAYYLDYISSFWYLFTAFYTALYTETLPCMLSLTAFIM